MAEARRWLKDVLKNDLKSWSRVDSRDARTNLMDDFAAVTVSVELVVFREKIAGCKVSR